MSEAWEAAKAESERLHDVTISELFAADPERGKRMNVEAAGVYLDYSKHRIDDRALASLIELAAASGVSERAAAMFSGASVNTTEHRPALHIAMRAPMGERILVAGVDVVPEVHDTLARMHAFAERIREGAHRGATGRPIRNVVNIGIGGSHLGPALAHDALRGFVHPDLTFRFVSNVDATDVHDQLEDLDPEETLFVVVSKSFTTAETMMNAGTARDWLLRAMGDGPGVVAKHFAAVSSDVEAAGAFGVDAGDVFPMADWVGGRYSISSAVGLTTMIAIGGDQFGEFLGGMHEIDVHFRTAPPEANLPILMGMLSVWYIDLFGAQTAAVLPYANRLRLLPDYLQQLVMESNGKHVTLAGDPVERPTSPIVWGSIGTLGQHSFHQLLHQGTVLVPCDFLVFLRPSVSLGDHDAALQANALAQAEALAFGKSRAEFEADGVEPALAVHMECEGNRPSSTFVLDEVNPRTLGRLIALYEHSVFVQGVVWQIDSFDQWGVQLGKVLAGSLRDALSEGGAPLAGRDSSTTELVRRLRDGRARG